MSALPPRIGLTTYREPARWVVWDEPADVLHASYSGAIEVAGGVPLLVPPSAPHLADTVLDALHGLVITGGADIEPTRYAANADAHTGPPRADRDAWEFALLAGALARDLPVLAICRGMQVLNVALGGTLHQHLPDTLGSPRHCPTVGRHAPHPVRFAPGSSLAALLGPRREVASYHHQGVDRLGAGLVAVGWALDDGLVEAVEYPDGSWVVGVQWHPEATPDPELFGAFVAASAKRAGAEPARPG